jgi:hypothetical protein
MKKVRSYLWLAALATFRAPANAQSASDQFTATRQCSAALDSGDTETARMLAEQMLQWDNVVANVLRQAQNCVEATFGEEYQYSAGLGFASLAEIESIQAEREAERAEREAERAAEASEREVRESAVVLRTVMDSLNDLYRGVNRSLVADSVYETCVVLAERDWDEAFTNAACIESFLRNGHPDLPGFAEFAVSASPIVVDNLEPSELELLQGLTEEQVEQLCRDDLAALCELTNVSDQVGTE